MIKNLSVVVFLLFLFSGCEEKHSPNKEFILEKINSFDKFNETTLFSDIRCMTLNNNSLFMSDYNLGKIFEMDITNFELKRVIGKAGEGPGEISTLPHFAISENNFFLENDYKRTLEVYSNNGYSKTISLPNDYSYLKFNYRFFVKDKKIHLSHSQSKTPILIIQNDNEFEKHGNSFQFELEGHDRIRNDRNLFDYKGKTIAVSDNMPIIQFYNENYKLEKEIDVSSVLSVKDTWSHILLKDKELSSNSYMTLFQDAYIHKDRLYILLVSYEPYQMNKIIVFDLDDEKLEFKGLFKLPNYSIYNTFAVNDSKLYGFNYSSSSIDVFKLP